MIKQAFVSQGADKTGYAYYRAKECYDVNRLNVYFLR